MVVEAVAFISDVNTSQDLLYYVALLFFTVFVGISEELFFRGIILSILKKEGTKKAIYISSIMFVVLHLVNLAGGMSIEYALLQLIFALLFGIVCAQLVILKGSILLVIEWHFTHDFIAFVTGNELNEMTIIISIIQIIVLIGYALYMH